MSHSRRRFLQNSSFAAGAVLINPFNFDFSNALFSQSGKFEMLRKNVGYFTGRGGTIGWLINEGGIAVVDSQFPPSAKELIAEIRKKSDKKVDFLINTHHHGDHSGGNIAFKEIVENVTAHENSKANQMRVAKERESEDTQLYPNMTFSENWKTSLGDEVISCSYHGRGHTNGDIVTHFQNANIVHMGDLLFNRRFPYIDKGAGAHIGNWINILDAVNNKFDSETQFIFGHAGEGYEIIGNHEDIKAFKNYLESLLEYVSKEIKSGKSVEEMKEGLTSIPGAPEWKGDGIERSLSSAHMELTEENKG